MHHAIQCPSGLIGVVRPMSMREEVILTDRKLQKAGGQIDALLRACWVEALEPGPYSLGNGPLDWSAVLQCDRFHTLLQIRVATYGPSYVFSVNCQSCRARIDWEVDLTDLPVRLMTAEDRATFAAGNRFPTTLPDAGVKAWFKLLTGQDERTLPQLRKQSPDRPLSTLLAHCVVQVDGVDDKGKRPFLENLSMRDANHLVAEFDRVDGATETSIQIECIECFAIQDIDLPFAGGLFMPSPAKTKRRSAPTASSPS